MGSGFAPDLETALFLHGIFVVTLMTREDMRCCASRVVVSPFSYALRWLSDDTRAGGPVLQERPRLYPARVQFQKEGVLLLFASFHRFLCHSGTTFYYAHR